MFLDQKNVKKKFKKIFVVQKVVKKIKKNIFGLKTL